MKYINTILLGIIILILLIGGIFAYNIYQESQDEKRLEKIRQEYEQGERELKMLEDIYDDLCEEQSGEC